MPRQEPLYQWTQRVTSRLPTLSPAQARVLALWSFGIALLQCCALSKVSLAISEMLGQSEGTIRQRLREYYWEAEQKRGQARCELDPSVCFGPLLRWAVGDAPRVALALDVTNLADRFHVLAVAVLCRGGAVPVAWTVLRGGQSGQWNPHWKRLLTHVSAALAEDSPERQRTTIVLTDRGLESAALFRMIADVGLHPMMRLKSGGTFRPTGWRQFHPLPSFAGAACGARFRSEGELYRGVRLRCLLLTCRAEGCEEPWLLATDLESADAGWYAFRSWIEQGFKDFKRGGFQWQNTRMTDPQRVERMWLAIAVATLWALEAGADAEPLQPPERRTHSLFARGLIQILIKLLHGQLATGKLPHDSWPETKPHKPLTEQKFLHWKHTYP